MLVCYRFRISKIGIPAINSTSCCLETGIRCENGRVTEFFINGVVGAFPPDIGLLTELTWWETDYGRLEGEIPASIGNNTKLRWLSVDDNQMSGILPEEICKLKILEELWLGKNQFSGGIPPCVGLLFKLRIFEVSSNELNGTVTEEICKLTNLEWLQIHNNRVSGGIPSCIGMLQRLTIFDVSSNELNGTLTDEICKLTILERLKLTENQFSGGIPACIGLLKDLIWLDLAFNTMSGTIPTSIGDISGLQKLYFSNDPVEGRNKNNFSGSVPASFNKLTKLEELYLNVATLNGSLPDLSSLLNLRKCSFTPSGFCISQKSYNPPESAGCNDFLKLSGCDDALVDLVPILPIDLSRDDAIAGSTTPIIVISILGALIFFGAIGIVVYFVRKRRQKSQWNGYGSSFTPSEAIVMSNLCPSDDLLSDSFYTTESKRASSSYKGSKKGKKLVWGKRISAGAFGEVWSGKYGGIHYPKFNCLS